MLTRYYQIACDACGWTDHFVGDAAHALVQAKAHGWITGEDEKHYCGAGCRNGVNINGVIIDG